MKGGRERGNELPWQGKQGKSRAEVRSSLTTAAYLLTLWNVADPLLVVRNHEKYTEPLLLIKTPNHRPSPEGTKPCLDVVHSLSSDFLE